MHQKNNEEILDDFALEVRRIEQEAEKIIKEAESKKEHMISQAKSEASELMYKKQADAEKRKEEKIKKSREKADLEKQDALREGRKEIASFEKKCSKNIPKAVEFVLKKLDEIIG